MFTAVSSVFVYPIVWVYCCEQLLLYTFQIVDILVYICRNSVVCNLYTEILFGMIKQSIIKQPWILH